MAEQLKGNHMARYRIEIEAAHLSGEQLLKVLERELSPALIVVNRIDERSAPTHRPDPESAIVRLLADGRSWKGREIVSTLAEQFDPRLIAAGVRRLTRRGELKRIRHGTYILLGRGLEAAASPDTAVSSALLSQLVEPRTRLELQAHLQFSPQTVGQALASLVKTGEVLRCIPDDGAGEPFYSLPNSLPLSPARAVFEPDPSLRLLSAMLPGRFHTASDVGHVAVVPSDRLNRIFEHLTREEQVASFRLGSVRYAALTEAGNALVRRYSSHPKAPPADMIGHLGSRRAAFLQILASLGSARTVDVTRAIARESLRGPRRSAAQPAQSLLLLGLIEAIAPPNVRQPAYRLTHLGERVVAEIDTHQKRPERRQLESIFRPQRRGSQAK